MIAIGSTVKHTSTAFGSYCSLMYFAIYCLNSSYPTLSSSHINLVFCRSCRSPQSLKYSKSAIQNYGILSTGTKQSMGTAVAARFTEKYPPIYTLPPNSPG